MKRPWWGTSPWRLGIRGAIHLVIAMLVLWGCAEVLSGRFDLADSGLADHEATVDRIAMIVAVAGALLALYSVGRVVVAVMDLAGPRRTVEGRLIGVRERATGDMLPGIVQHLIYRDSDRDIRRQRWVQLDVDTDSGPWSWTVRPQVVPAQQPGSTVRVQATRILGYVTKVEVR